MNICLIGLRGCGKSNVSRRLASATKRAIISTDALIQYDNDGITIGELVENEGWAAFREREFEVVRKAARMRDAIIDCGGGVIVDLAADGSEIFSERKVAQLRSTGIVVWLDGDVQRLTEKTAAPTVDRPTLSDITSIAELMHARLPFYEKAATLRINIESKTRKEIAFEICQNIDELKPYAGEFIV